MPQAKKITWKGLVTGKNTSALDGSARWVRGESRYWKGETNYVNPRDANRLYPYHPANIRVKSSDGRMYQQPTTGKDLLAEGKIEASLHTVYWAGADGQG